MVRKTIPSPAPFSMRNAWQRRRRLYADVTVSGHAPRPCRQMFSNFSISLANMILSDPMMNATTSFFLCFLSFVSAVVVNFLTFLLGHCQFQGLVRFPSIVCSIFLPCFGLVWCTDVLWCSAPGSFSQTFFFFGGKTVQGPWSSQWMRKRSPLPFWWARLNWI